MKKVYILTKHVEYHDKIDREIIAVYKHKSRAEKYINNFPESNSVYYTIEETNYIKGK